MSMDFIEGIAQVRRKGFNLVVTDRFTKYSHFLALSHPPKILDASISSS